MAASHPHADAPAAAEEPPVLDVVVYSAGPGGIAAAIMAARSGARATGDVRQITGHDNARGAVCVVLTPSPGGTRNRETSLASATSAMRVPPDPLLPANTPFPCH